jgi:hypothetical protein
MHIVNEIAVYIGVAGMMFMLAGMMTYLYSGGNDPGVLNPKYGFLSHIHFISGGSLFLLCVILKLVVHLVDPSIPIYGPALLWYRLSSEKGYELDESFYQ